MVRFSRTSFIGRVLYAATASVLSVVAVAIASGTGGSDAAPQAGVRVIQQTGALTPGGGPSSSVLEVGPLAPGESTDGTVTVANRGKSGGLLTLSAPDVSDAPGSGGGALSDRLQVTVLDVTDSGVPELVYAGGASAMTARTLDYLQPGQARTYLIGASFIPGRGPTAADGDGAYAGGSARLELDWGAMTASALRQVPARADDEAPKVKIEVPGRQDVLLGGQLNVRVLCSEVCTSSAELKLPGEGAQTVPSAPEQRSPARTADLTLDLPAGAQNRLRAQLAAGTTVVVQARATARDAAGNRATATRRIGLTPTP